jgi:hypothetical protein
MAPPLIFVVLGICTPSALMGSIVAEKVNDFDILGHGLVWSPGMAGASLKFLKA